MTVFRLDKKRARPRREGAVRYVHAPNPTEITYWRDPGTMPLPDADEMVLLSERALKIVRAVARDRLPTAPLSGRAPDDIYPVY